MTVVWGEPVVRGEPVVPIAPNAGGPLTSLADLVHRSVERSPDKEAIRWKAGNGWSHWSYAELWDQVATVSIGLRGLGLGAGDRVVILSRSRPEWLVADLACLALGAVTCPLYPGDPPARMAEIVQRVGARFMFVEDPRLLHRLRSTQAGTELEARAILFEPGEAAGGELQDGEAEGGETTLTEVSREADASPETRSSWESTWRAIGPAQVATIVHTLGVDGEPLGVVVSHANLLHAFQALVQAIPIREDDTVLSVLPMSHMFERCASILSALGVGATVAFAERQIERWAADMAEVRPTLMSSIPLFFDRIAHRIRADVAAAPGYQRALFNWAIGLGERRYANHLARRRDGTWLRLRLSLARRLVLAPIHRQFGGRLRFLFSGGAALSETTGRFFDAIGIPILEGYGLTETAPALTANRPESYRYGTVGPPLAGTELRIDPVSGEILARGPQVMLGYLDRPLDTARVLDGEGWLRTGDIGEFDEAHRLRITGRRKNLLVLATGKNVAPAPIEEALVQSPYIAQAVVLGDDRDATGVLVAPDLSALQAGLELTDVHRETDTDLLARPEVTALIRAEVDRLTAEFAAYERPRRVVMLPRLLKIEAGEISPTGRPDRAAVLAAFPEQVAELFDRSRVDARRAIPDPTPHPAAGAAADSAREPDLASPG